MRDALGVGALNADLIYELDDLDVAGLNLQPGSELSTTEEQFLRAMDELGSKGRLMGKSGGGSAANAIYAMSRLGLDTSFIGTVGLDDHADLILREMGRVDMSHVRRTGRSGVCISMLSQRDRSLLVLPNANNLLAIGPEEIDLANRHRVVHLSSFLGNEALKEQMRLVEGLVDDVIMSFDPGERYANRGLDEIVPFIRRTDILFVNDREIMKLTGQGAEEGCRRMLDLGPDIVVLKRGAQGSVIYAEDERIVIMPVAARVVDKTGAGDVYAGSFLAGIIKGWGLRACGEFAAAASAHSIEHVGRTGYPDKKMLAEFSKRRK